MFVWEQENGQKNNSETNCSLTNNINVFFLIKNITTKNPVVHKSCRLSTPLGARVDIGSGGKTTTNRKQKLTSQQNSGSTQKKNQLIY